MTDSMTLERMTVFTDGVAGPHIMVPLEQLDALKAILQRNNLKFWVDSIAVSLNGRPEVTVVNFSRGTDAARVQQLLDAAK